MGHLPTRGENEKWDNYRLQLPINAICCETFTDCYIYRLLQGCQFGTFTDRDIYRLGHLPIGTMIGFLGYTSSFSIKIVHRVSPEATDQSNPLHFDRSVAGSIILENTVAQFIVTKNYSFKNQNYSFKICNNSFKN